MKSTDEPLSRASGIRWQLLGEIELPIDSGVEVTINTRLLEILTRLNLQEVFLYKILQSAQDSLVHTLKSEGAKAEFKYIHLFVFAQTRQAAGQQTWGFFRFERIGGTVKNTHHPTHSVELYLYLEGS